MQHIRSYEIVGTKGRLHVDPAYEYVGPLVHHLTLNGVTKSTRFPASDQFAAELIYFSDCILHNREPEPPGVEGLIDVQIVQALYRSSAQRKPIALRQESMADETASRYPTSGSQAPTRSREISLSIGNCFEMIIHLCADCPDFPVL
jgi:Oxidoreductase family, C-terminal alpha/beta domain